MSSHYLIAIATSAYPHLPVADQRPQLSGVLTSIVELFTKRLGPYQHVLPELAENPPAKTMVEALDKWFGAEERDGSDWVVLYYTGHGALPDDKTLYLLTSDFKPGLYSSTSVRFDELATMIGGDRGPGRPRKNRNILLIVDTCFAGAGVQEISNRFSTIMNRNSGGAFRVLGAALPKKEAQAGALARALIETIDELAQRHVMQEVFYLEQIAPLINRKLRIQNIVLSITLSSGDEPRFFLNPSYVDTGGAPVAANVARKAILDSEFRDHWGPRARGVEFDNQPGHYFTGRKAVLSELVSYLQGKGDARTRVVIGRPGAGKSAILAHLVTQSMAKVGDPNVPTIDFALHAKGQRLNDVRIRLGNALGVEPKTEEILKKLQSSATPFRVVVDALDEAAEPKEIARELLGPMTGMANTRLVLGTRASELPSLYDTENINIDERQYSDVADIAHYVASRLERRDEPDTLTPYRDHADLTREASSAVARSAFPNFLIARLHTEYLLAHPELATLESLASLRLPTTVGAAFEAYLARFGDRETAVRDILIPLAWAEGQGLPWDDIWAPLASALSGREYVDDDIKRVLDEAGAFVLESTEQGRSVYRLYHQALTDTLRRSPLKVQVNDTFVDVLTASVPQNAGDARPDWLVASQYVRRYLASHASRCGRLTPLLSDPLYLLAAEPVSLLREIAHHPSDSGTAEVALYTSVVHHLRREPVATASAYLELAARQRMLEDMAREVSSLSLDQPWHVPWANWTMEPPRSELAKGQQNITALSVLSTTPDDLLAAVGRADGVVEVWNVVSGDCVRRWECPTPHPASVHCVTIVSTSHGRVVVAGWAGGQLGRFDLDTGECLLAEKEPNTASEVMAMCMAERSGEPVCITAHRDRQFYIRELTRLSPIVRARTPTAARIYDMRVAVYETGSMVITVGDHIVRGSGKMHPTVHGCSLVDLSVVWSGGDPDSIPHHVKIGTLYGRTVAVVSRLRGLTRAIG